MNDFLKFEDFITFKYSHIGEFLYNGKRGENANSYALVMKQTYKTLKAGIIDADGKEIVPCKYRDVACYYGKYYVQDKKWHEVDMKTGTILEKEVFAKDFNYNSLRSVLFDAKYRATNMKEYMASHPEVNYDNTLYCSILNVNEHTISISADTKEDLADKKIKVLNSLLNKLTDNINDLKINTISEYYESKTK